MSEILASLSDINAHLPANVQISNNSDPSLQVDALRLIRGQLVSIFTPAVLNSWTTPETTPELIRSIAGRLIASKYYAKTLAGNVPDEMAAYAVSLYNEAIGLLTDIKSGAELVVGIDGNVLLTDTIGSDSSADMSPISGSPVFSMGRALSGDQAIGLG
jgi:hypothetical protein